MPSTWQLACRLSDARVNVAILVGRQYPVACSYFNSMSTPGAFNTTPPSGSDARWRVPVSTTPQLLLSSSQDERARASIFNHSNGSLYIIYGSNLGLASSGSSPHFDAKIASGTLFELPKPIWQGQVWGAWDVAAGWAMVNETGDND